MEHTESLEDTHPPSIGAIDFGIMLYFLCYVFVHIGHE